MSFCSPVVTLIAWEFTRTLSANECQRRPLRAGHRRLAPARPRHCPRPGPGGLARRRALPQLRAGGAPDGGRVRALVPAVARHFGQLDAVVNNASRFEHDDARSFTAASLAAHVASNTAAPV